MCDVDVVDHVFGCLCVGVCGICVWCACGHFVAKGTAHRASGTQEMQLQSQAAKLWRVHWPPPRNIRVAKTFRELLLQQTRRVYHSCPHCVFFLLSPRTFVAQSIFFTDGRWTLPFEPRACRNCAVDRDLLEFGEHGPRMGGHLQVDPPTGHARYSPN